MTNMNKLLKSLAFALVLLVAGSAHAQTILTTTTLSAAVPSTASTALSTGNFSIVTVASATGITAPTANTSNTYAAATGETSTYLYVDREMMQVKAVSGTTITVIRGVSSTAASSHLSGALVFIVPAQDVTEDNGRYGGTPAGSCNRANILYLPNIQWISGTISDCLGGQWVNGDAASTQRITSKAIYAPNPGGTIYTSLNSTGTTLAATTMYCTEIQLPYNKQLTGLAVLNGTVVGTDNHLVVLYDSSGNLLANSAAAGVLAATASNYQQISFTSPYYAVGPAQYFGCLQTNGTAATVRMLVTQVQDQYLTKGVTGQTFGTIPATITVPTTFTTAVGPYLGLF